MPVKNDDELIADFVDQFDMHQIIEMFNLIPDILFWVKDNQGKFIYANKYCLEHMGVKSLKHVIGRTDYDFSPPYIAEQFRTDDAKVMKGEAVSNRLEMNAMQSGEVAWFITSKRPLFNPQRKAIGSYGISRHLEKTSLTLSGMDALKKPVKYIQENYMNKIQLNELATLTHLSVSALERRFKKHLNKTPKQFLNETRLENARRLLVESNLPIAIIANECGFSDHSYFSRQFNLLFGQQPSHFRKNITS